MTMRFIRVLAALFPLLATVSAQEAPPALGSASTGDDGTRVAILGYHEFSADQPPTAMRIRVEAFREQLEAIKNLGLPVISLEDFIAWKKGEDSIPPRAIVITIDDGWKSVYTHAYPILKEYGYPFTVYLYKNYVDGGGRALTTAMIKEMQKHGCSIGSHSVSHPFPGTVKRHAAKGPDAYQKFLHTEMVDSREFLKARFDVPVTTYAYPGGYYTDEMFPIAQEAGYEFLFTVKPGKVRLNSDNRSLPRYIILGNHKQIFQMATTFRAVGGAAPVIGYQTTPHPVLPEPGSMIESRLPTISADLSAVENLDPDSLVMRVSGFGKVPAFFLPDTKTFQWKVQRRLRQAVCEVTVTWRLKGASEYANPMRWSFLIDREASYQAGAE
ncbi:MAG: polysaccharide deacetylase family protein [Akkermansiaceae bacterium]|nr:polysaccharide deacetylase family protein [Akkermansiaceae bacterium]NNM30026.1 polysaccharide deacetylase family protein [Akkermansiaceae bacterium]